MIAERLAATPSAFFISMELTAPLLVSIHGAPVPSTMRLPRPFFPGKSMALKNQVK